jgi:sugar lactone lactonase YvrE
VGLRGNTWSVKLSRRVTAIEPGPCDAVFAVTTRGFGWLDVHSGSVSVQADGIGMSNGVGKPDGLAVDTDGCVWLAVWGAGQVWQLDPQDGRVTTRVSVPTPLTTSCAFGGARLSTLYVTTASRDGDPLSGLLYAAEVPAKGSLAPRFAGAAP